MRPQLHALEQTLAGLDRSAPDYAVRAVDAVLSGAWSSGASDIHLQPTAAGLALKLRLDGVLQPVTVFPPALAANLVARLKVLARLLTYRTDGPQEGRIRAADGSAASTPTGGEMRVSVFPALGGEKVVVRLFGSTARYEFLDELGLPADVLAALGELLHETSGAILISGPAGSGKTTTAYACLREIARHSGGGRSLASIEDPVEVAVDDVAQSQVNPHAEFDLATGLRFLMRQDPEVILVGEIRDRATAEAALQASLTGHLVISTFHAGSAAETVGRLLDMGIEPYVFRSGLLAVLNQRLVRKLCGCARPIESPAAVAEAALNLPVRRALAPVGCPACDGLGYSGRLLLAEMLRPERFGLGRAILARVATARLERRAQAAGMMTRWQRGCAAIEAGQTTAAEIRRVLGCQSPPSSSDGRGSPNHAPLPRGGRGAGGEGVQ